MIRGILFFIASMSLYACGSGPKIPVMLWSQERQAFEGKDAEGDNLVIEGKDIKSDKLVCTTPQGFDVLTQWIKRHKDK